MHRATVLADTPLVRVFDARCLAPTSGYDASRESEFPQIMVARRGVFGVQRDGEEFIVDSGSVLVVGCADVYRTRHPGPDGDDCTDVVPTAELLDEWSHGRRHRDLGRLTPRDQLSVTIITRILADPDAAPIETDEHALLLLHILARAFPTTAPCAVSAAQRARVDEVRSLLASAPTERWHLAAVAKTVHCSPFHLARQFRMVTSETISQYLLRLRLALAAERLADGELNLSVLAVETGFAHQSHFTTRFHRAFGITPAAARDDLNRSLHKHRTTSFRAESPAAGKGPQWGRRSRTRARSSS
jgi:AraC-like DNA-binding protein